MHIHEIDQVRHKKFLNEERKDPVTKEKFKDGDRIVFCAGCKSAFLESSWQAIHGKHCKQQNTLLNFPDINAKVLRFGSTLTEKNSSTLSKPNSNSGFLPKKYIYTTVAVLLVFLGYTTPLKNLANPLFWESLVSQGKSQVSQFNKQSPDKFLQDYYSLINNREYSIAWNRLSTNFQNNKLINENGYTSYTNYWKTIERVEVLQTTIESNTEEDARVYVQARYFIKDNNKSVDENHRLFLVWDKKTSSWLIDSPRNLEALLRKSPEITNPSQLRALNRQIYNQINPAWTNRSSLTQDLIYRVGVVADGKVVGYEALSKEANYAVEQTPLPNLLYGSDKRGGIINEPIALFRVTFRRQGILEVTPWLGYSRTPDGLNYTNLQKLLAAGNWFEADKETEQVMLQAVGLGESNSISYKQLSSFPCTDLRTIDNLWKKYSNGRFGFSVQKEIYLNAGGKPDSSYDVKAWKIFGDSTGWRVKGEWIKYGSLEGINFSTSAPPGHLPYKAHLTMGARRLNDLGFFPRMYSCNL